MKEKKFKIVGIENCEPCKKIKEAIEKMKKKNVEYVELKPEIIKELAKKGLLPKDKLKEGETKVPFGINEEGEYCEIYATDEVVLTFCKNKIKVLYDKETAEIIEAIEFLAS